MTYVQALFSNGSSGLLLVLKIIPVIAIISIAFTPAWKINSIRSTALAASLCTFLFSLALWVFFDPVCADFQFRYEIPVTFWYDDVNTEIPRFDLTRPLGDSLAPPTPLPQLFNFSFGFGVDGVNLWLVLITSFLTPICILVGWLIPGAVEVKGYTYLKIYCLIFLAMESILIVAFTARDLLVFYLFFEAVLIPMFLLVGIFGSKPRNIRAAYKMFIYTLVGSLPMLAGILMVYFQCGSTDLDLLSGSYFSPSRQMVLWMLWFVSFGVKTPLIPFHGWLPETHSNAPTAGSIMLAGILLKLGTYGFIRWSLSLFPLACIYFSPIIYCVCLIGIIYVSLITLRQVDIKKIIAYSSIAHMGCTILGMFAFNIIGLEGSLLMMIGHGVVSPGLFLCIGILYDRYKTRVVYYYGGLAQTMPLFSAALLILTMANISLPILSPTFAAELLIFTSIFLVNKLVAILASLSMVLTGAYGLFLYCRICFGTLKTVYIQKYSDLSRRECAALVPFVFLSVIIGLCPNIILDTCHASIASILFIYNMA